MSDQLSSSAIIAVVGPTATGKTALAFQLAETALSTNRWTAVSLISVDSRQVYKELEICTGVDIPEDWQRAELESYQAYRHPELPIFLYGTTLITPDQEWSVAHFREYALPIAEQSLAKNELVILVGGTGLYHEHLFSSDAALDVAPNVAIRQRAAQISLLELQSWVQEEAEYAWQEMNDSDRQNPRRLIRALEKTEQSTAASNEAPLQPSFLDVATHYTLGVTDDIKQIKSRVEARVMERLKHGAVTEVESLTSKYPDALWTLPAFTSTGCRELRAYIEGKLEYEQLIELWTRREVQYAKRQLTWWKSHPQATTASFKAKKTSWYNLSEHVQNAWQTAAIHSCILGL